MSKLAPVVMFVYNRLDETKRTIESLEKNFLAADSDLFIFADGPKTSETDTKVNEVREYIRSIKGFKNIIITEAKRNKGLAKSNIEGISKIFQEHEKAILMEDDLSTSPNFLSFMNQALDFYGDNKNIISVTGSTFPIDIPTGYKYDVYFSHRMISYGWGTWADRWNAIDWDLKDYSSFKYNIRENFRFMKGGEDLPRILAAYKKGKADSWSVRFVYHQYKTGAHSVHAIESKGVNIGFNSNATHTKRKKKFDQMNMIESTNTDFSFANEPFIDKKINKSFLKRFTNINRIIANYLTR